jgi:hypothetical protein
MIWFSPEMSGTEIISDILKQNDFIDVQNRTESELITQYPHYKVICGMRNPYERVFLLHLRGDLRPFNVNKHHFDIIKEDFNKWIDRMFIPQKLSVSIDETFIKSYRTINYLKKWDFNDKIPNFFIKKENIIEDLTSLGLNSDGFSIEDEINQFNYYEMYDFNSAKRVYQYYKKHFHLCNYNPFSFTTNELTEEEKISFIHDPV